MKHPIVLLLLLPAMLRAGDNEQTVSDAPISSVVVYLAGAEVTHQKQITLSPGRNELHFTGLTSKLIPKSIQFTATGDVSVLAISNRIDYLYGMKKNDAVTKQLSDSLKLMQDAQATTQGMIDAYTGEKQLLDANRSIGGTDKGVASAELKLNADFYLTRITEINTELVKLNRKLSDQQEIIARLDQQISEASTRTNPPMGEVIVLVNASGTIKLATDIVLRYVVSDAGWAPSYDLIAEDVDKPIDLKYRAKVFNNTDVDWTNVKLKLSTADPMQSAAAPQLDKWTLNFDGGNTAGYGYSNGAGGMADQAPQSLSSQNLLNSSRPAEANGGAPAYNYGGTYEWDGKAATNATGQPPVKYNEIQISELNAEFDIRQPYDIPADGKPYIVDVAAYNLNASFQYHCVPKMDRDAFLMARITGWEDLDLVEGPANVYFGGTYVGQSYIYTRSVDDTLDLSFGRDQKLVVTRTNLQSMNNDKMIGSTKKETYSYEIDLKNTRKSAVPVVLKDQIPVSEDAEITVEATEMSKGVLDPATGIITWNFNIQPGETQKVILTYTIRYPKSKTVTTRKFKSVACPSF